MSSQKILKLLFVRNDRVIKRLFSSRPLTNEEVTRKRSELFDKEKARQASLISRIEKIEVQYKGVPEECSLLMNKGLSTPFNCAMHIQEVLMTRSVVALVNGQPWDMHRPLTENCELNYLHFRDEDPSISNEAFWRTGSFLLGYVMERAFKDKHYVELCSFPPPDVRSGSFVYDVDLKLPDWTPSKAELNCLSRIASQLEHEDVPFERLEVDASVAAKMFEDNRFKSVQIPHIAAQSPTGSTIVVYRLKDHVDITKGPLISTPQLIGRFAVAGVHSIESPEFGLLRRVQGVALPRQIQAHFWTYGILCDRASKLNTRAPIPGTMIPPTRKMIGS